MVRSEATPIMLLELLSLLSGSCAAGVWGCWWVRGADIKCSVLVSDDAGGERGLPASSAFLGGRGGGMADGRGCVGGEVGVPVRWLRSTLPLSLDLVSVTSNARLRSLEMLSWIRE